MSLACSEQSNRYFVYFFTSLNLLAFACRSHYGCNSINGGNTYTHQAIDDYIQTRMNTVETMAKALTSVGYTKILEVHSEPSLQNSHLSCVSMLFHFIHHCLITPRSDRNRLYKLPHQARIGQRLPGHLRIYNRQCHGYAVSRGRWAVALPRPGRHGAVLQVLRFRPRHIYELLGISLLHHDGKLGNVW